MQKRNAGKKLLAAFLSASMVCSSAVPAMASSGTVDPEAWEGSRVVAKQIEAEGIVLLENKNSALPLEANAKVNVFGTGSLDPFLGGGGSGAIRVDDPNNLIDFYEGLEGAGISWNEDLRAQYRAWYDENYEDPSFAGEGGALGQFGSRATLAEMPVTEITDEQMAAYQAYSDTAVIVISRCGTESADLSAGTLRLSDIESGLVDKVATTFGKVVVLFNIDNIMEMGFLEEYDSIQAAAIIWAPGEVGMDSVGKMLSGEVNPSGKLADTVAYHITDHPANENFGQYLYDGDAVDPNRRNDAFVEYEEGIYVGYRYFETFENARDAVQYPFGYGLSYTDFAWDVSSISVADDTVTAVVEVANTGDVPGKDVVQVYFSAPYTGSIEKPAVELAAFAKTRELQPGESQTLTVTYDVENMASYDMARGAWVLEAGTYDIRVCHDVRTTEAGEEWSLRRAQVRSTDSRTGAPIENRFADADYGLTTLSRADAENTYPTAPVPVEGGTAVAPPENVPFATYEKLPEPDTEHEAPITGAEYDDGVIMLEDVYKAGALDLWNSPLWDKFLDQLTVDEMIEMAYRGGFRTVGIDRLGIPATVDNDGPAAVKGPGEGSYTDSGIAYPVDTVLACTWNTELARAKGEAVAVEAEAIGTNVWYAPGINIHRSPRGGRNFEYYSEDPLLCGKLVAELVKGAQSKGLIPTLKHFAVNEQEQGRESLYTWLNEQSLRELYLKPFEIAVKEADALGVMSSFNRIGATWAGANKALLTDVLRGEWGFRGFVVTDYLQNYSAAMENYFGIAISVYAGNDTILEPSWADGMTFSRVRANMRAIYAEDPAGLGIALRKLAKNLCYMKMHTLAFDGVSELDLLKAELAAAKNELADVKERLELSEEAVLKAQAAAQEAQKTADQANAELAAARQQAEAAAQAAADAVQAAEEAKEEALTAERDAIAAQRDAVTAQKDAAAAQATADAANAELTIVKGQLSDAKAAAEDAQAAADAANAELANVKGQLTSSQADIRAAQAAADRANADLADAKTQLASVQAEVRTAQAAVTQSQADVKIAQAAAEAAQKTADEAKADLRDAQAALKAAQDSAAAAQNAADTAKAELEQVRTQAQEAKTLADQTATDLAEAKAGLQEAMRTAREAKAELEQLKKDAAALKAENEANANAAKELAGALDKIAALEKQVSDLMKASPVKAAVPKTGIVVRVNGVHYKVTSASENGGTAAVTEVAKKTAKKVTIADSVTIDGYTFTVNAIRKNAFKGCKKLSKITIDAYGISKIGANAFKGIKKKAVIETPSAKVKRLVKKSKGLAKSVKVS